MTTPTADNGHDADQAVADLGSPWRGGWTGTPDEQFTTFARTAGPALLRLAWLLTGDPHRAEDLVQHTLVRTYTAWPRARDGDPMAYARRILANARTDTWRRNRREVTLPDDDRTAPWGARTSSPSRAQEVVEREALVDALRTLSSRRRRVVVLRYLMDLTEREVATDLGISVGTVKSTAARGLTQLRALLEEPADATAAPVDPAQRGPAPRPETTR